MAGTSSLLLLVVGRVTDGVGVVGGAVYQPLVLVGIGAMVLVVVVMIIGVALPAVWSRKPDRRQAAAAVLRLLLAGRATARKRVFRRPNKAKSVRHRHYPSKDQQNT